MLVLGRGSNLTPKERSTRKDEEEEGSSQGGAREQFEDLQFVKMICESDYCLQRCGGEERKEGRQTKRGGNDDAREKDGWETMPQGSGEIRLIRAPMPRPRSPERVQRQKATSTLIRSLQVKKQTLPKEKSLLEDHEPQIGKKQPPRKTSSSETDEIDTRRGTTGIPARSRVCKSYARNSLRNKGLKRNLDIGGKSDL